MESQKDPKRQEKLRSATEIGLEIISGSKVAIDADKMELYDAIEKLIKSGLITNGGGISLPQLQAKQNSEAPPDISVPTQESAKESAKKPDLNKIGRLRRSSLESD
ncbi:hypothetical protein ACFQZE_23665 [Paenibacillus sp. GCM10027627]